MKFVKWLRKNNKKLMAVVVIVIMFGFVGGTALTRLLQSGRSTAKKTAAYFADDQKITGTDLSLASRELEILKIIGADALLRSQDLQGMLLSELLFSNRTTSPAVSERLKRAIRTNGYRISNEQINNMYNTSVQNYVYWLLLKKEAQMASMKIPNENAGNALANIFPQLGQGLTYSQVVTGLIRRGIPEKEILTTFANLLAVWEYTRTICASENITIPQIRYNVSIQEQPLDIEFVKFDSFLFVKDVNEPTESQISAHFEKCKKILPGSITQENPYGFGYKSDVSLRLEYLALKLDDISQIITPPTQEDAEEHYQKNREMYAEQVPSDPNDPNSPMEQQIKSFPEVADIISNQLLQSKIDTKAEKIIREAILITETDFEDLEDTEISQLTSEQFAQTLGDYNTATEQLSKKYNVKIYTGKTGMLTPQDMQADELLNMLYVRNYLNPLPQIVFAVDELATSKLGPFDAPKPRLHQNIGPLRDLAGTTMMVIRVTETQKATEPESLDQTVSIKTIDLVNTTDQTNQDILSVKQKVIEDLKTLAAMDIAKSKAQQFIKQIVKNGWDGAIDNFNKLYGNTDVNEPNAFHLQTQTNVTRISNSTFHTFALQTKDTPSAALIKNSLEKERQIINQLYSLVPQDANSLETVPVITEVKSDASFYVIKSISVKRIDLIKKILLILRASQ